MYPSSAEVYWVQEEPRNMGPWWFIKEYLGAIRPVSYVGRPESAATAAGSAKRHEQEQRELIEDAFAPRPVVRKPRRLKAVKKKS
jgi:2-oxoglutarate dehydrogenase E1 component